MTEKMPGHAHESNEDLDLESMRRIIDRIFPQGESHDQRLNLKPLSAEEISELQKLLESKYRLLAEGILTEERISEIEQVIQINEMMIETETKKRDRGVQVIEEIIQTHDGEVDIANLSDEEILAIINSRDSLVEISQYQDEQKRNEFIDQLKEERKRRKQQKKDEAESLRLQQIADVRRGLDVADKMEEWDKQNVDTTQIEEPKSKPKRPVLSWIKNLFS